MPNHFQQIAREARASRTKAQLWTMMTRARRAAQEHGARQPDQVDRTTKNKIKNIKKKVEEKRKDNMEKEAEEKKDQNEINNNDVQDKKEEKTEVGGR